MTTDHAGDPPVGFDEAPTSPLDVFSVEIPPGAVVTPAAAAWHDADGVASSQRERLAEVMAANPKRPPAPRRKIPRATRRKVAMKNLDLRRQVVDMRVAGLPAGEIADALGITRKRVYSNIDGWLRDTMPSEQQTEDLRKLMLERLESLHRTHWLRAQGVTPTGRLLKSGPNEKSAELVLKVMDREAKLMGVDLQPDTTTINVTAEAIAAFLGWDDKVAVVDVQPSAVERIASHPLLLEAQAGEARRGEEQ